MSRRTRHRPMLLLASLVLATLSPAQWSSDPTQNLAVADGAGEQVIPLVATTADGSTYVAWFDNSTGSYRVRLQRLDAAGVEAWPHNGVLVSAHPQDTALFGWDMIADSSGNAVLVFSDIRDGGDLDVFAYRVDPTGSMLWGANGVQLSFNPDFDPAPRVAQATDGDFVFVWQRDPAVGDGDVRMQRLSPAGSPRFAAGGLPVVASAGEDPGFVGIVPATSGEVIVSWLRSIRTFSSPRHVRAQKFSTTGAPVWAGAVSVYDAFSVPIGYFPKIQADGAGGAILWWHRSDGSLFNSFVQRLDASGAELFPHNGVAVSTNATMYHLDPTLSVDPSNGEMYVFWNERNSLQSQWGILGQKLSAGGVRQWADAGVTLLPVNTQFKSFPRSTPLVGGALVFLVDRPAATDRLIALRVDTSGAATWGTPLVVSSASSTKSRYPVASLASGAARVAWEDNRAGTVDVFVQNVNVDGTLGLPADPGRVAGLRLAKSTLTQGHLTLAWSPSCSPGAAGYAIYEGRIGTWTSHVRKDCVDDGGDRIEEVDPDPQDSYYLVVAHTAAAEGSYGTGASGERPVAPDACRPAQSLAACP